MAIRMVDHKSDDFESFPALLGQADTKTAPRVRKKKKSVLQQDFDDVDGEMSMELDDSGLGECKPSYRWLMFFRR